MKIISLQAENLKRLKAVEIRPDGNLVQVTGRNGAGKTSVLDAIWWAMAGTRNVQAEPIRRGAEKARIRLDLGELVVTRTFTAKEGGEHTTNLTVETAEGARFGSPQAVLDAIIGDLAFDPPAFGRMAPKDQFNAVRALVPDVDFEAIAKAQQEDFDARAAHNRRAKELRAQAQGIGLPAGPVPAPIDLTKLEADLANAASHNVDIEQRRGRRAAAQQAIDSLDEEIAELAEKLDAARAQREALASKLAEAEALPEPIDTAAVQQQLQAARLSNAHAERAAAKAKHDSDAQAAEDASAALTRAMATREAEKQAAIAKAKLPVEGLSFGADHLILNGAPFDQASDAEQLRASIAIAGALNPKLRVIRVRDGSLLDEDGMAMLAQYAEANDLQVWVEKVDSTGAVGFVIEDGQLKGAAFIAQDDAEEEAV